MQLCFGHCVSIPTVEAFQKYVAIYIKFFSCCSANKVVLSVFEFMETLHKTKRGNKSPSDHDFVTVPWLHHVGQKASLSSLEKVHMIFQQSCVG